MLKLQKLDVFFSSWYKLNGLLQTWIVCDDVNVLRMVSSLSEFAPQIDPEISCDEVLANTVTFPRSYMPRIQLICFQLSIDRISKDVIVL